MKLAKWQAKTHPQPSPFAFKLCLELGLPHPVYLDYLLTKEQMRQWIEYYNTEPFLADRLEAQLAIFMNIIAQIAGAKNTKISDFMICKPPPPSKKEQIKGFFKEMLKLKKENRCKE